MKAYLIAAAAFGVVAYFARNAAAATLKCAPGSTFRAMTEAEAAKWSAPVRAQVKKYGGSCFHAGQVTMVEPRSGAIEDTAGGVEDPVLITHPWQLL